MNSFDMFTQVEDVCYNDYEEAIQEYLKEQAIEDAVVIMDKTVAHIKAMQTQRRSLESWHDYIVKRYFNYMSEDDRLILQIVYNIRTGEEFFHQVLWRLF